MCVFPNNWYQEPQVRGVAVTMNDEKISIKQFDGSNFGFWKMQIEDYLYSKDLYQPLEEEGKLEKIEEKDWKVWSIKVMSAIRLSLSMNAAYHTTKAKTAKEMMEILEEIYQKPTTVNKVHLIRWLFNFRMSESTPVQQHLNEFT